MGLISHIDILNHSLDGRAYLLDKNLVSGAEAHQLDGRSGDEQMIRDV